MKKNSKSMHFVNILLLFLFLLLGEDSNLHLTLRSSCFIQLSYPVCDFKLGWCISLFCFKIATNICNIHTNTYQFLLTRGVEKKIAQQIKALERKC